MRFSLVKPPRAAAILGVTTRTLQDWRVRNIGPRYIKQSARKTAVVLYDVRDLESWAKANTHETATNQ